MIERGSGNTIRPSKSCTILVFSPYKISSQTAWNTSASARGRKEKEIVGMGRGCILHKKGWERERKRGHTRERGTWRKLNRLERDWVWIVQKY